MNCKKCGNGNLEGDENGILRCSACGALYDRYGNRLRLPLGKNQIAALTIGGITLVLIILFLSTLFYFFTRKDNKEKFYEKPKAAAPITVPELPLHNDEISVDSQDQNETAVSSKADSGFYVNEGPESAPETQGTLTPLAPVRDSLGFIYFTGFYKNTGETPIVYPKATVTLYDSEKKVLATAFGYGLKELLFPGEETIVRVLVMGAPEYDHFETVIEATPPYRSTDLNRGTLKVEHAKMVFDGHGRLDINGTVTNTDLRKCTYVKLAVVIYKDKKIAGSGFVSLSDIKLEKNQSADFSIYVTGKLDRADSFVLESAGNFQKE